MTESKKSTFLPQVSRSSVVVRGTSQAPWGLLRSSLHDISLHGERRRQEKSAVVESAVETGKKKDKRWISLSNFVVLFLLVLIIHIMVFNGK